MSALIRTLAAAPLALAITLLAATPARAAAIYTYTGNNFTAVRISGAPPDPYATSDRVTGFFSLAVPLQANLTTLTPISPASFSFSDGVNTITDATATSRQFSVTTDPAGNIVFWTVLLDELRLFAGGGFSRQIISANGAIVVRDGGSSVVCGPASTAQSCRASSVQDALIERSPGTWQRQVTQVPEPTSMLLIGAALAGFAARRRLR